MEVKGKLMGMVMVKINWWKKKWGLGWSEQNEQKLSFIYQVKIETIRKVKDYFFLFFYFYIYLLRNFLKMCKNIKNSS